MEVQFKLKTTMQKRTLFSNTLRANVKNMRTFVPTPTPPAKFITVGGEGAMLTRVSRSYNGHVEIF